MLHFCHADLFGIFLLRFLTSRKDSRQAGMTILKGYVNLINAFVLITVFHGFTWDFANLINCTIGLCEGHTYAHEPHSKQSNKSYSFVSS